MPLCKTSDLTQHVYSQTAHNGDKATYIVQYVFLDDNGNEVKETWGVWTDEAYACVANVM